MPAVSGVSVVGRQVLMPFTTISDGRMSLFLPGQDGDLPRLYGGISIETVGGVVPYQQIFYRSIWVPGTAWTVDRFLLPGSYRAAVWWKREGLDYTFNWV